jgi:hypothetical protein
MMKYFNATLSLIFMGLAIDAALDLWHKGTLHAEEMPEEEEKPVVVPEPRQPRGNIMAETKRGK